ncbi:hypothetical protein [Defluviimonas sp. SAOS-178_SWC]|uniref:hypothetical protein n=1 Tax=Defluviimonas sp. SAOS-178_SWC TaxID=3121287 RepID=UPI0032219F32
MTRHVLASAILAVVAGLPATAEEFVVQLGSAYNGASDRLLASLETTEIQSFSVEGANFVILDAPNEAYVQAFFYALRQDVVGLNVLEANWTAPAFAELSLAQRLGFLRPVQCEFCRS